MAAYRWTIGSPIRPMRGLSMQTWPSLGERALQVRALQVNGRFCPRARLPAEGAFTHHSHFKVRWMSTTLGGWERKPTLEELTSLKFDAADLGPWLDAQNAELTVYHAWDDSTVGIQSIDYKTHTIRFSNPAGHPPRRFWRKHPRMRVPTWCGTCARGCMPQGSGIWTVRSTESSIGRCLARWCSRQWLRRKRRSSAWWGAQMRR